MIHALIPSLLNSPSKVHRSSSSMEERPVPPPGHAKDNPPLFSPESQETYVVQVPRDQVYRIPPPENARIVEHYTRNFPNKDKNNRCFSGSLCWIISTIAVLAIVLVASIMIIRATLYSPRSPKFTITQIKAKNLKQILLYNTKTSSVLPPAYDISLHAENPNPLLSVSYHGPGEASLIFKSHMIGHGGIPSMIVQEEQPSRVVNIHISLSGKGVPLSPALKLSLISKMEKIMHLKIKVPMEVNSWLKNEMMDLTVACDFMVDNSLLNHTRITSQECSVEF